MYGAADMKNKPANLKGRGGPGRGQGRKPLSPFEKSVVMPIRMTESQRNKLKKLGGAKWVRAMIDASEV